MGPKVRERQIGRVETVGRGKGTDGLRVGMVVGEGNWWEGDVIVCGRKWWGIDR